MAGDRIRIDDLPTTILPSLEHVIAAMKDGETFGLTLEQVLSLYEPPTSPTLDAPTVQNILTLADAARIRRWGVSDADIDALAPGPSAGLIFEAGANKHLTLGIRGADADTGLQVLDKGNGGTTYANQLLLLTRNAFKHLGNDIWHAGNLSRGEELISSGVVSSSIAQLEITLPANYKTFRLGLRKFRPAVNTTGYLVGQYKVGGNYINSASGYMWANHYWGTAGSHSIWGSGTFSNAFALVSGQMNAAAPANLNVDLDIDPGAANHFSMGKHRTAVYDSSALGGDLGFHAQVASYGRVEAIRLLYTVTGNIGNGEWYLWGQR